MRITPVSGFAVHTLRAMLLCVGMSFCSLTASATDIDYDRIGWWNIVYRELKDSNSCSARVTYTDGTILSVAANLGSNFFSRGRRDEFHLEKCNHYKGI